MFTKKTYDVYLKDFEVYCIILKHLFLTFGIPLKTIGTDKTNTIKTLLSR